MENNYKIYCHLNKINGKRYIGQTKTSVQKRWGHNGYEYIHKSPNSLFAKAINKYGWDNFEHQILFENLTKEEANQKEIELIAFYKSNNKNYGYNLTAGGNSNTLNEEQKEQRSKLNYVMWENGVFKKAINKEVYCIELNLIFESVLEAERLTGVDNSTIQKVCKNQLKYAGFLPNGQPLHWIYAKDKNDKIIQELKNKKEILKGIKIPIECIELNKIFNSSKEAAEYFQTQPETIRRWVRKGWNNKNNQILHWKERFDLINTKNKISVEKLEELIK